MIRGRALSIIMVLGVALAAAPGCDSDSDGEETITIGLALSTTGGLGGIGQDMVDAAILAAEQINAAGGVLGKQLKLRAEDPATDTAKATEAAEALKAAGVPAVVGAVGSGYTLAVADVLGPAQIVQISPSSTSPALTDYANGGYLFRTCPSDALQGQLLAKRALNAGFTTAAILSVPGAYGEGLADKFEEAFTGGGGTITSRQEYAEKQAGYADLLQTALADTPEALAMLVYPEDGATMVKNYLTDFATTPVTMYFADALANDDFLQQVGVDEFANLPHEGTAPTTTGPNAAHLHETFNAKYGKAPGAFLSNTYDAVYLIALAIEKAGAATGPAIRAALQEVSAGGTKYGPQDYAQAIADIAAGQDIDYTGASGEVDFDAAGDVVAPYDVWHVVDGAIATKEGAVMP